MASVRPVRRDYSATVKGSAVVESTEQIGRGIETTVDIERICAALNNVASIRPARRDYSATVKGSAVVEFSEQTGRGIETTERTNQYTTTKAEHLFFRTNSYSTSE